MFKSCLQNVQISAAKVMIYCKIEHKTNKKVVAYMSKCRLEKPSCSPMGQIAG